MLKKECLVSGINCSNDITVNEMRNVKKQFFKTDGIECFHGIQSFEEGEVTPEVAHLIGIKSVSFIDGKRFSNTKKDYAMMRKASDKLCEGYGLSVLSQDEKYDKYATSSLYKTLMRDCIDYAIKSAKNYEQFIKILEDLGYIVTERNNTLSIRREPYKRNTRIERQFGKQYTIERLLGINPENSLKSNMAAMTPELIREIKQMDEYSKQGIFLTKNNIETEEQLAEFEKATREKINRNF